MERKLRLNNCAFLAILHRIYMKGQRKRGGIDIIIDSLIDDSQSVLVLEYQLGGKYIKDTEFEKLNTYSVFRFLSYDIKEEIIKEFQVFPREEPLRWLGEIFATTGIGFQFLKNKIPVCICSDPLNVLSAWILKCFGKVGKIYFHSVDYSDRRFKNTFLNGIYHSLYRFAIRQADLTGVVSRGMEELCLRLGIKRHKLIFVPNSPDFDSVKRLSITERVPFSLVVSAGSVVQKSRFDEVVMILSRLVKYYPRASLKIIGNTEVNPDYLVSLKKMIGSLGLENNVKFLGFLSREENLRNIADSTLGLAMYSDDSRYYMRYADPLKIREYAACGLPIISDKTTSTGKEMEGRGCGFTVGSPDEAVERIIELWSNSELYEKCSKNALGWAKENDKKIILSKLIKRLEGDL